MKQCWYGECKGYTYHFAFWKSIWGLWLVHWSRQDLSSVCTWICSSPLLRSLQRKWPKMQYICQGEVTHIPSDPVHRLEILNYPKPIEYENMDLFVMPKAISGVKSIFNKGRASWRLRWSAPGTPRRHKHSGPGPLLAGPKDSFPSPSWASYGGSVRILFIYFTEYCITWVRKLLYISNKISLQKCTFMMMWKSLLCDSQV